MSIVALCLRLCAVQALKGRTLAGPNIADSSIAAIDELAGERKSGAFAVVYTDEDESTLEGFGNALSSGKRKLDLTIDMGIAEKVDVEDGGSVYTLGETDGTREAAIDILKSDIMRVLQADTSPYAEAFRLLAGTVINVHVRRGAGADKGVRFAAREICLSMDACDEPMPAAEISDDWRAIIDLIGAVPGLMPIAASIEQRLTASPDLPDWKREQALLGLTNEAADAIGLAPVQTSPLAQP
ncbi:hypothetical protein BA190_10150 [Labrys sp. WJW]|uniref:hypothetical protein n=1 Tax=Labrys sp. WJW TaxID=1737983 RepID=UPI0008363790|nr:hypothetical protein [Labrys sp. WJW]OCC05255.1 hypothetical protein BA190_10150 [Labrys sp. WJW]